MSNNAKKFITGAGILAVCGILAKCLSLFFRIPLASEYMLGDEGIGYYQLPYPIYSLLIAISYLGLPSAISKLVSERIANGKYKEAHSIFRGTFLLLVIIGTISSMLLFFGAGVIIKVQDWPLESKYSLYGLALAPLFVSIMGAYRGYFQGMQNMKPTAISQLVESFGRVIVGVGLAAILLKSGLGKAAGGASFGATAGAILGSIFLTLVYLKNKKEIYENISKDTKGKSIPFAKVAMLVVVVALPITLGAAISSIINLIDSSLVIARLTSALHMPEKTATQLFGVLSGKAITLINVPLTVSMAIVLSIMPAISEAVARNEKKDLFNKIELGIRLSLLIGLPSATGLAMMSGPIMTLLYGKTTNGGSTLAILSISLIFVILGQLFAAILQGMGKFWLPICNLAISAIVKCILTYILVAVPILNVNGAALATVVTDLVYTILNYIFVKKYSKYKSTNIGVVIIRPVIATLVMAICTKAIYVSLRALCLLPGAIVTLISIGVGAIVYFLSLIVFGVISDEDFESIPCGDKIQAVFRKLKVKV